MKKYYKLKISLVGPYPPFIGGTSAFLSHLVPALEDNGIICKVFNTKKGYPNRGVIERLKRLFFFVQLAWKVNLSSCDVVHCHAVNWANLIGHSIILAASRLCQKPTVLTLHAGDLMLRLNTGKSKMIARWILKLPHVITTVTPDLHDVVVEIGGKEVYFIPNSLEYLPVNESDSEDLPTEVAQFIATHNPIVVSVGAIEPIHGVDILVKALSIIRETHPNLGAVIIAYKSINAQYQTEIKSLLAELDLEKSTWFPNALPSVHAVVKEADVFVRATLSDGDSISVREALALGVPTVASDVGFRPDGVITFLTGDHIQLAAIISEVLSSPQESRLLAVESDNKTIEEYLKAYKIALRN